jgi:eukaryotic-like serine/threonine-protein kinase
LARVLDGEPDWSLLPPRCPAEMHRLLRRTLEKDPRRRTQHIGDARIEIEEAMAVPAAGSASTSTRSVSGQWRQVAVVTAAVAFLAAGGTIGWSVLASRGATPTGDVLRFKIPGGVPAIMPFGTRHVAISSDGLRIAYASSTGLTVRRLGESTATQLTGVGINPIFSPDGAWIAYFDMVDSYRKIPSSGGVSEVIASSTERPLGVAWGAAGTVVFATTSGLYRVPDDGSIAPRLLARPRSELNERVYAWPQLLPGERGVLFTILPEGSIDGARIAWLEFETREIRTLLTGGAAARYLPTGYLAYVEGQRLMVSPFDIGPVAAHGDPVATGISVATARDNAAADFAVSDSGTLVSVPPLAPTVRIESIVVWVDREGNETPLPLRPALYNAGLRISPDGTRIALDVSEESRDIWILDVPRASLSRLTDGPTEDILPVWSSDGRRIFFASDRAGNFDVYSQAADGSTGPVLELARPEFHAPLSITPDGRQLLVIEEFRDIELLDVESGELRPLLHRDATDWLGEVSPDGAWLAYESNEAGAQVEIFLRPFPDVDSQREKVSIDGGRYPRWGPAGSSELYYVAPDGSMMAATVELAPSLRLGETRRLFMAERPASGVSGRPYDVAPDGRFLLTRPETATPIELGLDLVVNWRAELMRRVALP